MDKELSKLFHLTFSGWYPLYSGMACVPLHVISTSSSMVLKSNATSFMQLFAQYFAVHEAARPGRSSGLGVRAAAWIIQDFPPCRELTPCRELSRTRHLQLPPCFASVKPFTAGWAHLVMISSQHNNLFCLGKPNSYRCIWHSIIAVDRYLTQWYNYRIFIFMWRLATVLGEKDRKKSSLWHQINRNIDIFQYGNPL